MNLSSLFLDVSFGLFSKQYNGDSQIVNRCRCFRISYSFFPFSSLFCYLCVFFSFFYIFDPFLFSLYFSCLFLKYFSSTCSRKKHGKSLYLAISFINQKDKKKFHSSLSNHLLNRIKLHTVKQTNKHTNKNMR